MAKKRITVAKSILGGKLWKSGGRSHTQGGRSKKIFQAVGETPNTLTRKSFPFLEIIYLSNDKSRLCVPGANTDLRETSWS